MNKEFTSIDLTHTLSAEIPTWDGGCGFELSVNFDYKDCTPPDLFRTQKIQCGAGIGTHIDAPAHCVPGGKTVDGLDLKDLVVDCVVIDVSHHVDENYIVMPEVVQEFEKEHGEIPDHSLVIFYTGWSARWETPETYHNNHIFPSVHLATAQLLLARNIVGLGIDTLSSDTGGEGYPVHRAVLGAGKYLVENIGNNVKNLPRTGAKILVLPMKIKDGTEAPVRLIALI